MSIQKRYASVNWIDGMKITKQHFIDTENYLVNQLSDLSAARINSFNYGLLPATGLGEYLNDFTVENKATKEVEIVLRACDAITPSGLRITITGDHLKDGLKYTTDGLKYTASLTTFSGEEGSGQEGDKIYYLVISINPYERQPAGELDPDEVPPRHPYSVPKITLNLMHESSISAHYMGGYFLVVGKVVKKTDGFYKDAHFVPPCTTIRSHPLLVRYYEAFGSAMNDMQLNAFSIVQKIKNKQQKSELAHNIKNLCEVLLHFIAQTYFRFRNVAHQQPPIYTVENFSTLANVIYTSINTMPEKDKEEMLKYFYEWCDVLPSSFESLLGTCVEVKYDHLHIGKHMTHIEQLLGSLWLILNRLNTLEYIGQHKENIVVREEVINQAVKEKKGWSILD